MPTPTTPDGSPKGVAERDRAHMGRVTGGDPLPPLPRAPVPEPNDEDRAAAAATGKSAEYWASLRVVNNLTEWEAAREAEAKR